MGRFLNPGNEGFGRAVRSEIYVDKSELIAYTNSVIDTEQGYLCVSRPRRFGKSITANMLCAYYSRGSESSKLFQNLKISTNTSYLEHLNQYDVLFFNMQHFLSGKKREETLTEHLQNQVIEELKGVYGVTVPEEEKRLSAVLSRIYESDTREKKGFVFIVDEWDCIFREMKEDKEGHREYLDFLKDLFKDRNYVKLAYMTGILPIKKYGTHSALNIFYEYSMTNPKKLAEYIGFTEKEVKSLCEKYNMDYENAKRWYDGYYFKKSQHIYNPKSIVDAMNEEEFHSYWTGTETYEALKIYMEMNFDHLKDAIMEMLGGGSVRINPRRFQNDMTSFETKDDVLTLLVHLGYLAYNEETQQVFIPNMEVAEEFQVAVEGTKGWEHLTEIIRHSEELLSATLKMDSDRVASEIDFVHSENTSILAYNDENSLSCVISLAYISAQKEYTMIREFPSGKGFADIVFLPYRNANKPAMVVELKWDKDVKGAISQIKEKGYVQALKEYAGEILLVGINYDKKNKVHQCVIEEYRK